jgi:hypothetical protein
MIQYDLQLFLDYDNAFFPLQAYFLPTCENGEVLVLGKLPYTKKLVQPGIYTTTLFLPISINHNNNL